MVSIVFGYEEAADENEKIEPSCLEGYFRGPTHMDVHGHIYSLSNTHELTHGKQAQLSPSLTPYLCLSINHLDFTNILRAAFTCADHKRAKRLMA